MIVGFVIFVVLAVILLVVFPLHLAALSSVWATLAPVIADTIVLLLLDGSLVFILVVSWFPYLILRRLKVRLFLSLIERLCLIWRPLNYFDLVNTLRNHACQESLVVFLGYEARLAGV